MGATCKKQLTPTGRPTELRIPTVPSSAASMARNAAPAATAMIGGNPMTTVQDQISSTVERIPRGLAIRGVIAIVFGVAVLVWPNITLQGLTLIVGAFALVDGLASLAF